MEPTELTPQQQRESFAQSQKFERANTLASLKLLPKSHKAERSHLFKIADAAHALLHRLYDEAEDDGLAGYYGQVFETTVERLRQLLTPPAPVPSDPPA